MALRNDQKPWLENETADLIRLREENISFAEIAKRLSKTKVSCIGQYYRLRKLGIVPPAAAPKGRAPRKRKEPSPVIAPAPAPLPPPETGGISLIDLNFTHCRWPLRVSGHEHFFCGETIERRSYCAYHYKLSYTPPPKSDRPFKLWKR